MDFSTLKIEGLSKQDATLVKDNANATIEDLMQKGLTPNGETTLRNFVQKIKPYVPKKQPLTPARTQPKVMPGAKNARGKSNEVVTVYNNRTQRTVTVSAKAGEKLLGKLNKPRQMGQDGRYNQAGIVYEKV